MPRPTKKGGRAAKAPRAPDVLSALVGANVAKLLAHQQSNTNAAANRANAKISQQQLHRLAHGAHSVTLRTLAKAAGALGVPAWSLLVEALNPAEPPVLTTAAAQKELTRAVAKLIEAGGGTYAEKATTHRGDNRTRPDSSTEPAPAVPKTRGRN